MNDNHKVFDEVLKVPPLSPDEEIRCLQHVRAGDERAETARERLVEANLHLVVSIVERYRNDRIHILDLIVKGNDALMAALQTFDGEDSFSAYATAHVERAIADFASSDWTDGIQPA